MLTLPTQVAGAILIDSTLSHLLLVKASIGKRWFFPKGKANFNESIPDCARREVLEETGFDIDTANVSSTVFTPDVTSDARLTLYGVTGVPLDFRFMAQAKEIGEIRVASLAVPQLPSVGTGVALVFVNVITLAHC